MARTVFAEESLKKYIQELAPPSGYNLGLILGQRSAQRDYVIHLPAYQNLQAKTEEEDAESPKAQAFKSLQEVNAKSFANYAKQVTAFLSGGMWVLGIYSTGPEEGGVLEVLNPLAPKLQTFMNTVFTKLAADPLLYGSKSSMPEKLVMHFNSSTNKATCKSVNLSDTKWYLSNTDWKFQAQPIKWQEVENRYAFDLKNPIKENDGVTSLKSSLDQLLKEQAIVINKAHCFVHGEVRNASATLESIRDEGAGDDAITEASIHTELQIDCTGNTPSDVEYKKCSGDLLMNGHVYSRIYMHPKSTVGDTITALKEDIIRSLHTRFELHTDALIEEEEGSPEEKIVQHDLPRRILIPLPFSQVKLSNYLFPGENPTDSITSVKQLLGIEVDEDYVEEGLEEEADPELVLPILTAEDIDLGSRPQPQQSSFTLYVAIALGVLFVALCASLFLVNDSDEVDENIINKSTN